MTTGYENLASCRVKATNFLGWLLTLTNLGYLFFLLSYSSETFRGMIDYT